VDADRRREEVVQDTEEAVRRTEVVEADVEVRDREVVEVEVEAVASGIATMTGKPSDQEAILAADHHHLDEEVEAQGEAQDTTVAAGALAGHHRLLEEVVAVLPEVEDGGEATPATAAVVGAPAESEVAEEGGDE